MATYAYSVNFYDRYTDFVKQAAKLRFDTVFGAHVVDDPKLEVSDLQLLQYLASIATPEERAELERLTQNGYNMYDFWGQLVKNPVFKKRILPMFSQAALQEAREPGSSYIYHNAGARAQLLAPQLEVYNERMPLHNPQLALSIPGVRTYIQKRTVPTTIRMTTEKDPSMPQKELLKSWSETPGYYKENGTWYADDPNQELSDVDAMRLLYSIANPKEQEYLRQRYDQLKGYSMNLFLADLVSENSPLQQSLLPQLVTAAQTEASGTGKIPAIWRNKRMYNFYNAQKQIYDKKIPFQSILLGTPGVKYVVSEAPYVGVQAQTKQIINERDPGLSWKEITNTEGRRDVWDPLPEKHNGGGDMEYVVPAMAIGAPLALLGGMQGGLGTGLGLLGLAGALGYGYGYGKTRGWKGWEWADKTGDTINGMLSNKKPKKTTTPKVPEAPPVP